MITRHFIIYRDSRLVLDGELYPLELFAGAATSWAATAGVSTSGAVAGTDTAGAAAVGDDWSCMLELLLPELLLPEPSLQELVVGAAVRTTLWSGDDGVLFAGTGGVETTECCLRRQRCLDCCLPSSRAEEPLWTEPRNLSEETWRTLSRLNPASGYLSQLFNIWFLLCVSFCVTLVTVSEGIYICCCICIFMRFMPFV